MAEYIKREDALKIADEYYDHPIGKAIAKSIFCLPAADVEEKRTGKWVKVSYVERSAFGRAIWHKTFQCSRCGGLFGREGDKYCYNCGANMREEKNEND
jgi:hypothetical protein